jgi:hypothetical protein
MAGIITQRPKRCSLNSLDKDKAAFNRIHCIDSAGKGCHRALVDKSEATGFNRQFYV